MTSHKDPLEQVACLDVDSLLYEIHEAPEAHDLDPRTAAAVAAMPRRDIATALINSVDDAFYAAYDSVRRDAIALLADRVRKSESTAAADTQ